MNQEEVLDALRDVIDPELGVNIVDLGLVYSVSVANSDVQVKMTMTTRACPLASYINESAETAIRQRFPDIIGVDVEMVWEPPWNPGMMSEPAKRQLGWSR